MWKTKVLLWSFFIKKPTSIEAGFWCLCMRRCVYLHDFLHAFLQSFCFFSHFLVQSFLASHFFAHSCFLSHFLVHSFLHSFFSAHCSVFSHFSPLGHWATAVNDIDATNAIAKHKIAFFIILTIIYIVNPYKYICYLKSTTTGTITFRLSTSYRHTPSTPIVSFSSTIRVRRGVGFLSELCTWYT